MNTLSLSAPSKTDADATIYLQITTSKAFYNIPLTSILFIECHEKKSLLHTKDGCLPLCVPLYRMEAVLPSALFLQTHRSFLVNLKNISHVDKNKDPWTISFFSSQKKAFVSRSFRRQLLAAVFLSD